LLRIENLNVSYSHLQVLWDVSLHVTKGEIVTLIGSNGAGKSTLVSTIFGLNQTATGRIALHDENILGLPPYEIVRRRLALVPEKRELFPRMTVRENLELGGYARKDASALGNVLELFPILKEREDQYAGTLSGGEQQMLSIGRALMARPKVLLLDEPSMGLAPLVVQEIFRVITDLRAQRSTAVLLVEQNARAALKIADRGYVLETGKVILEESASELLENKDVQRAYLGRDKKEIWER